MAKRRRGWLEGLGGVPHQPDLDEALDHGHDHDGDFAPGDPDDRFFGSAKDRDRQLESDRVRDRAFDHERDLDRDFHQEFDRDLDRERNLEQAPEASLDDEEQFRRDLSLVTPSVVVTWLLIGANVAVFALLVLLYKVPLMAPGAQDMLPWGANFAPYTTGGEWWRLFTCTFLHFGLLHIAFNLWILKEVGPLVERLVGNTGFLILYLGSGLVASMASTWWNPEVVSAGASGAIFGVIGALLGVLLLGHGIVPKEALSRLRKAVTTFVFYNVYIGLSTPGIDMAAHLGGLAVGLLCGMVMTRDDMLDTAEGREGRNLTALGVCGVCMVWMLVLLPDGQGVSATRSLLEFEQMRNRTDVVYSEALTRMETAAHTDPEAQRREDVALAAVVEELLPQLKRAQQELASLAEEDIDPARLSAVRDALQYLDLRIEGWEALVSGLRTGEEASFSLWQDRERQVDRLTRGLK